MIIEKLSSITEEIYQAFQRLIPQLNPNNPPPSLSDLEAMAKDPGTVIFLARAEDQNKTIIGSATLVIYQIPTVRQHADLF